MIKQLRKRHLQVWTILMLLLPIGILSAWLAIPKQFANVLVQPPSTAALPVILNTVKKNSYTVNLRMNNERTVMQLEWINSTALTTPSALIYKLNDPPQTNINENDLIGRIDIRGTFYFPLKNSPTNKNRFVLYDIIHRQVIDTINF